jgi:uncharacterized membrane protein YhaH (DUF805 family)
MEIGKRTTMHFGQAITTNFRKYADFSGRAARPEFWWWVLFTAVVTAVLDALPTWPTMLASPAMMWGDTTGRTSGLATAWSIAVLLPTLAATVRRLRDAGFRWGHLFWILLPLAGLIVLVVLCAQRSVPASSAPTEQPGPVPARAP